MLFFYHNQGNFSNKTLLYIGDFLIPTKIMRVILSVLLTALTHMLFAQTGGIDCSSAETISCGASFSSATSGTGADGYVNCGTEGSGGQRWFVWTAPASGSVNFNLCTGTSYDSRIHVYSGNCGALTCVAQNDDACGLQSNLTWNVASGTTYYIRVGGYSANSGTFGAVFTCTLAGCTYPEASNYDPNASTDNGTCIFNGVGSVDGCTDPGACNYCSLCSNDDGTCDYSCLGCTYSNASNFSATATRDDGSCIFEGCTDPTAINYTPMALVDDNTCYYDFPCQGDINNDGILGIGDLIIFLANFGLSCPN